MSQRNDLVPVSPDEGTVKLTVASQSDDLNSDARAERLSSPTSVSDDVWLLSAVEANGASAAAISTDLQKGLAGARLDDPGALLKQLYRKLNTDLYQQGQGSSTVSAVALVAKGKYATIAQTGDGEVFLMRAGRLNRVTRPAAIPTPIKGGKPRQSATEPESATLMLGARERLDARQPAIFELTLLPEDRVMICTGGAANALDEKALIPQLAIGDIERSLAVLSAAGGAAAVATVAAARERQPVLVGEPARTSIAPLIAAIVVVVLVILAVVLYGFL